MNQLKSTSLGIGLPTTENERFFEQASNDFVGRIGQQPESRATDIGLRNLCKLIRLARRGY